MIRFGVVGTGLIGSSYAKLIALLPEMEVSALCDLNADVLQQRSEELGISATFRDVRKMLSSGLVDAVVVTTPDFAHRDPVVAACEAGIDVIMEKPFGACDEDAVTMAEAIRESGIKCMVGYANRWTPAYVIAKQKISRGEIGSVVSMNTQLNNTINSPTNMLKWASKSTSGWFLLSHALDLANWFCESRPCKVYGQAVKKKLVAMGIDTYDTIQALVTYENDAILSLESTWVLPNTMPRAAYFKFEIVGAESALFVDTHEQMLHQVTKERFSYEPTIAYQDLNGPKGLGVDRLTEFARWVEDDAPPRVTFEDGYVETRTLSAIHESIKLGRPLEIAW